MLWRNCRPRMRRLFASSVTAIGLMLALLTPTLANAATPPQVSTPDASLTATWWEKFFAIPDENSLDRCNVGTGKILFLAGTTEPGGFDTRRCITDRHTFLVPLINFECSTAEDDGDTYAELHACAEPVVDDFTDLKLLVDGVQPVSDLNSLRVEAKSHFTVVEGNVFGVDPFKNSKFVADGYWALITLTPGVHHVIFGGSYPPGGFTTEVTYDLIVQN
jgi:hypothetical protein